MSDTPHDPPKGENAPPGDAPVSSVGHTAAREKALAHLGDELSAATIATVRRMHVSGEPGLEGWVVIARQVEAIAKHSGRAAVSNLRETVKEGK